MPIQPLDLPATPARLRALAQAGVLPPRALARALDLATASPPARDWQRYLARTFLLLGAALMLAGVICFFAFNWVHVGRFSRFALVEGALVAAALAGWRLGARLGGQVSLTAAAVLVGVLLAVYGQAYQTGADPYSLFLTWALLALPWALAARFAPLWLIIVALGNVSLSLYWEHELSLQFMERLYSRALVLAAFDGAAWIAFEVLARRGAQWLEGRWLHRTLATCVFGGLSLPACCFVAVPKDYSLLGSLGLELLVVAVVATVLFFKDERRDAYMLTAAGGSAAVVLATGFGAIVLLGMKLEALGVFLLGGFIIAEVAVLVRLLRPAGHQEES